MIPVNSPNNPMFDQLKAQVNKPVNLVNLLARPQSPFDSVSRIGITYVPPLNMIYPPQGEVKNPIIGTYTAAAPVSTLPSDDDSFDWTNPMDVARRFGNDGGNLPEILGAFNQAGCGSCWAVSSADALADRWAIANRVKAIRLSAKALCACTGRVVGGRNYPCCDGFDPHRAGQYLESDGIPSDECVPYAEFCPPNSVTCQSPECVGATANKKICAQEKLDKNRDIWTAQKGTNGLLTATTTKDLETIKDNIKRIKQDVWLNGPCVSAFHVFPDFMEPQRWHDGIYVPRPDVNNWMGGHAVVIVGWGIDDSGVRYWKLRNSWAKHWGDNGFFKVIMSDMPNVKTVGFDCAATYTVNVNGSPMNVNLGAAYTWLPDPKSGRPVGSTGQVVPKTWVALNWIWIVATIVVLITLFVLVRRRK